MKSKHSNGLVCWLFGTVLGLLLLAASFAAPSRANAKQEISVAINPGETYVIKDLSPNSTPAVHVLDNPKALVISSDAPGQLALLGAATGEWEVSVKKAAGDAVTYDVHVKPAATAASASEAKAEPVASSESTSKSELASSASAASASAASASAASAPAVDPASTESAGIKSPETASSGPAHLTLASASSTTAADPASGSPLPPVPAASTAPATPSSSSSAPASSPAVSSASATPASLSVGTQGVMTSQAAPAPVPVQKYRTNPLAVVQPPPDTVNGGFHYIPSNVIELASGSSKIIDFHRRLRRISIADTGIADLQVINPYQINLVAHKPGFTTLTVWDTQGNYIERQVRVDAHGKQQVMLNVIVAELDRNQMEAQGINWTFALPEYNISLVQNTGGASTPYTSGTSLTPPIIINPGTTNATQISTSASGTLLPGGELLPLLLSPNVSYGLAAQNSSILTQTLFQFLEDHNLAKILAEPHLLANSGDKAEFLSGGEIPIVIAQALNTSIVFKQFGTSVIFVPTVVGKDDIELEVKPEVSEPDYAHGVSMFGFTIPAFVTRKAQTFVRLKNGQTLIIAGLILDNKTSEVDKTPYLGDIPYLGNLFKHTSYSDQRSDLVMAVTPQIVKPVPSSGEVSLPTDRGPLTAAEIRTRRVYPPNAARPRF